MVYSLKDGRRMEVGKEVWKEGRLTANTKMQNMCHKTVVKSQTRYIAK